MGFHSLVGGGDVQCSYQLRAINPARHTAVAAVGTSGCVQRGYGAFGFSPALLLHGFGNLLGPILAVPVAILLGMKRETVGACHSINREYHMALINNIYGPDSDEARGSLSIYIVGGMVGTIYFGLMASVIGMTGWFHPQVMGLASGVGAGIMMASSSASLCAIYPEMAETITTMASVGETIAGITGIYITMFIAIPLCDKYYSVLEPKLRKLALKPREEKSV